jgi:hypothetical protein
MDTHLGVIVAEARDPMSKNHPAIIRRMGGIPGLTLLLLASLTASAASAAPTSLHWSTYLRAGPGETFQTIDELEHDTVVDVQNCANGWCRVLDGGSEGYVDQDALKLPATPPAAAPASGAQTCFTARQAGFQNPTRFCPTAPAPAPAKP